jgi:hypothetical protein
LITNYKMLEVPTEIAAIVTTKMIIIAIEGLGHDPLRAVGALLLELPGLPDRIRPRRSNVFRLADHPKMPGLTCSGPQIGSASRRTNSGGASA